MKSNRVPSHPLRLFVAAFTLSAQSEAPDASANVTGTDTPPSMKNVVQVMVELDQPPATAIYAEASRRRGLTPKVNRLA